MFSGQRYLVYYGGRAGGKSYAAAMYVIIRATQEKMIILCAREIQTSIKDSSKELLEGTINRMGLRSFFKSTNNEIIGRNGSKIIFRGLKYNPESIKGLENVSLVWCDEATSISQVSIDFLIPTIRKPGSQLLFTFNPNKLTDAVYVDFVLNQRPNAILRKVNYYDNEYLSQESIEELEWCKKTDLDRYNNIWLGFPLKINEANIFNNWDLIDGLPDKYPESEYIYGLDFGFTHKTAIVKLVKDGLDVFVKLVYYKDKQTNLDLIEWIAKNLPEDTIIIADSAEPGRIAEARRFNIDMKNAKKPKGSLNNSIDFVKRHKLHITRDSEDLIRELETYQWKANTDGGFEETPITTTFDDAIAALRYGLYSHYTKPSYQLQTGTKQ